MHPVIYPIQKVYVPEVVFVIKKKTIFKAQLTSAEKNFSKIIGIAMGKFW